MANPTSLFAGNPSLASSNKRVVNESGYTSQAPIFVDPFTGMLPVTGGGQANIQNPGIASSSPNPGMVSSIPNSSGNVQRVIDSSKFFQYQFSSILLLPANNNRNYLLIQNNGAAIIYVDFSGLNQPFTTGIQIVPGGYYEPFKAPLSTVSISGSGVCIEGLIPS